MKRILSVDDEEAILECFEAILTAKGYDITTTNDSDKALDILGKEDFDLVMLDVRMPKANGFEIYRRLKKKNKPAAVLFVTAYPASFSLKSEPIVRMWEEQFSDGNTDVLYKPFEVDTLIKKVEGLIGGPTEDAL